MRRLALPASCLALLGACSPAQDAPPADDSPHHAFLATIPLESPRGIHSLALAAEPADTSGGGRRLLVGMPGPAARVLVVDIPARALERVLEPAREEVTFGAAVEWTCDLDSDGEADIAVGVPSDDPPNRAGRVLLYSSSNGALIREVEGIQPGDAFGCSLATHGSTLVAGCPGLGEGGGYARLDLRAGSAPAVHRCGGTGEIGSQVLLAVEPGAPEELLLLASPRTLECRRLGDDGLRWSYSPPAGWLRAASGNNPGEIVLATRTAVSSSPGSDDPGLLLLLTIDHGQCRASASPGGLAAVADGHGLVVLDEQGGLEAFEWTPRRRSWVARPDSSCNPYWSALCMLPRQRVIAWAAAYPEPKGSAVGELRLYEVRR